MTSLHKGFTLVELMIVVAILGILAAIVFPQFQGHIQQAKESAAKDTLRIIRNAIELYKNDHNGNKPGYVNGVLGPDVTVISHLAYCSDINGNIRMASTPDGDYMYGPYIQQKNFKNPFNGNTVIHIDTNFSEGCNGTYGWLYDPITGDIRIDYPGSDSSNVAYFNY